MFRITGHASEICSRRASLVGIPRFPHSVVNVRDATCWHFAEDQLGRGVLDLHELGGHRPDPFASYAEEYARQWVSLHLIY